MILSTMLEQGMVPDEIDDTNPDDIYCGFFKYNAATAPNYCLIKRITKATIDGEVITKIQYPFGRFDWAFSWDLRKSYTDWRKRDFPPYVAANVNYGYLYNWYAATGGDFVAGWHLPSRAESNILENYLSTNVGGKLKETVITYWNSPNTGATNEVAFNGRASGYRSYLNGLYFEKGERMWMMLTDQQSRSLGYNYDYFGYGGVWSDEIYKRSGETIRLLKDDSIDPGSVVIDGQKYNTTKIGDQVWMAENLKAKNYANGILIPTITDNAAWAALITPGRCAYDNNEANV